VKTEEAVASWIRVGAFPLPKKATLKAPAVGEGWQDYAFREPDQAVIAGWDFSHGICVPMGGASRIEGVDFDADEAKDEKGVAHKIPGTAQDAFGKWGDALRTAGLGVLAAKLAAGYIEQTPSGGLHVYYRLPDGEVPGNEKWARYASVKTMIETRGTRGQFVVAPSPGYEVLAGSPAGIPVITWDERAALKEVSEAISARPVAAEPAPRPEADQNRKAYVSPRGWDDIFEGTGWEETQATGANMRAGFSRAWTRPGHEPGGESGEYSAVSSDATLMVFSSSAMTQFEDAGFPGTEQSSGARVYTMSQVYATLHEGASLYEDDDSDGYLTDARRDWLEARFPGRWDELDEQLPRLMEKAQEQDRMRDLQQESASAPGRYLAERAAEENADLRNYSVSYRLNPAGAKFEPVSSADKTLAVNTLEQGAYLLKLAEDAGCWYQNAGTHWAQFGTKSDATATARTVACAYGDSLRPVYDLDEEIKRQGTASKQEDIDEGDNRKKRLIKIHAKLDSAAGLASVGTTMVTIARGDRRYSFRVEHADGEPHILWAGGKSWSLLDPELAFASADPVHLKTAACVPQPGPSPAWDSVLAAVWPDPELRAWALREIAGVALWGDTSKEHPVLDGMPGGGKSTVAQIITQVLGTYAVKVDPEKILGGRMDAASEEETAALIGARLAWMDEPPPRDRQAISRFNDLASGTGDIAAARKYENRVSAPKRFNFLICQNPRNALQMDAQGVGERITYIPCNGTPESTLKAWEQWKTAGGAAEFPAILASLIRECALYRTGNRLPVPHVAAMARDLAYGRADEIGAWLFDTFDVVTDMPNRDRQFTANSVWKMYQAHTRDAKLPGIAREEFKDRLRKLGVDIAISGYDGKYNLVSLSAKAVAFMGRLA
jgi:hypothetical protein